DPSDGCERKHSSCRIGTRDRARVPIHAQCPGYSDRNGRQLRIVDCLDCPRMQCDTSTLTFDHKHGLSGLKRRVTEARDRSAPSELNKDWNPKSPRRPAANRVTAILRQHSSTLTSNLPKLAPRHHHRTAAAVARAAWSRHD